MTKNITKLFLRIALSAGFLSAVADRFGWWNPDVSAWGTWENFINYTQIINPWIPNGFIYLASALVTAAETIFGIALLLGIRTELFARFSGILILSFGIAMTLSTGIKGALDYSVFSASAGAFALSLMKEKYFESDLLLLNYKHHNQVS